MSKIYFKIRLPEIDHSVLKMEEIFSREPLQETFKTGLKSVQIFLIFQGSKFVRKAKKGCKEVKFLRKDTLRCSCLDLRHDSLYSFNIFNLICYFQSSN